MKKIHKQVKIKRYGSKVKDSKRGISYPMHTTEIPILTHAFADQPFVAYAAKCTRVCFCITCCEVLAINNINGVYLITRYSQWVPW